MKRVWSLVVLINSIFGIWDLGFGISHAAVPPVMNYQGKLTDAAGRLVPDGSYGMRFSLYAADSGGMALWAETWDAPADVPVANGMCSVLLGTHTAFTIPFDEEYWLGVEVKQGGSWETLSPRQRIASAAYALRADAADIAESVAEGTITTASLADGAVTADKIGTDAIALMNRVPVVSGISPGITTEGYSSFTATITGQNFQSVSRAKIGGTGLTGEEVIGSLSLLANIPPGLSAGVYDVSVSNINMEWGTGAGLFAVLVPTPTPTPTMTRTPAPTFTPTVTPVPWGEQKCEQYYGGYWSPDSRGGSSCWFAGAEGSSCTATCAAALLSCDTGDWHDPDLAACLALTPAETTGVCQNNPFGSHCLNRPTGTYRCYEICPGWHQNCGETYYDRIPVCVCIE